VDDHSFRSYQEGAAAGEIPAGEVSTGAETAQTETTHPDGDLAQRQARVFGNLEIRPDEIQALADGRRVGLTVREFQVLSVLAEREDRVVRRADIYSEVWGGEMKHRDRSVDVFVRKVRNKLARAAPGWSYIHTHFGVGYRFAATEFIETGVEPAEEPVQPAQPVVA
jgi:DNA-binding response OmpR family regulator